MAIHPENQTAVQAFLVGSSQWRFASGIPVGLDYEGLRAALTWHRLRLSRDDFTRVRVLEAAALEAMQKKMAKKT